MKYRKLDPTRKAFEDFTDSVESGSPLNRSSALQTASKEKEGESG